MKFDLLSWSPVILSLIPETAERTERRNTSESLSQIMLQTNRATIKLS